MKDAILDLAAALAGVALFSYAVHVINFVLTH